MRQIRASSAAWAIATAVVIATGASPASARSELTAAQMDEIRGGVSVTRFITPSNGNGPINLDNVIIDFDFTSPYSSTEVFIEAREGSRKVVGAFVATNSSGSGRFRARASIPVGRTFNLDLFHCTPNMSQCGFAASGTKVRGARLNDGIQVNAIRAHNLRDDRESTSFGGSAVQRVIDNLALTQSLDTSDSADLILSASCLPPNRVNLRLDRVDTLTVPRGCTRLTSTSGGGCPDHSTQAKITSFFDNLAASNGGTDFFHIFFMNDLGGRTIGVHYPRGSSGRNWVLVEDDIDASPNTSAVRTAETITHEYLHSRRLCHPDEASCTQAATANCTSTTRRTRNLMCSTSGGAGLLADQCTSLFSNRTNNVRDIN